jgi:tRNA pseudouridine38-40 synthase
LTARTFGILLTVAYDGTPFSGFARQADARTVQGELDGAVRSVDVNASLVRGTSRTDAGVHARAQWVAFDSDKDLHAKNWALGITRNLPEEIAIVRAARVVAGYDPRQHSVRKRYRYLVFESAVRDPFLEKRAWRIDDRLNHHAMKEAASTLVGRHDFRAFRAATDPRQDTVRHIQRVELTHPRGDDRCLAIDVEGDRFLHKMVRIIVGTLVDVGRGRLGPEVVADALSSGERRTLGVTAPAEGLYLEHIELDDTGQDAWPDQFSRD